MPKDSLSHQRTNQLISQSAHNLLAWYRINKREMPWRGHPDAYAVWVSEIMLQQTQVDTVRPYFTRFLTAFPTVQSLAQAEDEPLLKAWEGLGYYTRVRNLRKAAQILVTQYNGQLPTDVETLKSLPGIGAYTAAAIASIAFGIPEPVVDGNVMRVFARHNQLDDDFTKEPPRTALREWLRPYIIASQSPSEFNQAMMELGALICTPKHWACEVCPLKASCQAYANHTQSAYPRLPKTKSIPTRKAKVLYLTRASDGALLLTQHTGERLLNGFWELPPLDTVAIKTKRAFLYKQTFSHFHLEQTVYAAIAPDDIPISEDMRWAEVPETLPLTTATRKIRARFLAKSPTANKKAAP